MKGRDVKIGHLYMAKLEGHVVPVEICYGIQKYGKPASWIAKNLETGQSVEITKASRLRYELERDANGRLRRLKK